MKAPSLSCLDYQDVLGARKLLRRSCSIYNFFLHSTGLGGAENSMLTQETAMGGRIIDIPERLKDYINRAKINLDPD